MDGAGAQANASTLAGVMRNGRSLVKSGGVIEHGSSFDSLLAHIAPGARLMAFGLEELGNPHRPHESKLTAAPADALPPHLMRRRCGGPYQFHPPALTRPGMPPQRPVPANLRRFQVDNRVFRTTSAIPRWPSVGLTEQRRPPAAQAVEVTRFSLAELDRASLKVATCGKRQRRLCEGAHPAWQRQRILGSDRG